MVEQRIENPCVTGSIPVFGTKQCTCVAEWLGHGLQIRIMQVRPLSRTPKQLGVSVAVTLQTLTLSSLVRTQYPLPNNTLLAQLDRVMVFETIGWGFESLRACQFLTLNCKEYTMVI